METVSIRSVALAEIPAAAQLLAHLNHETPVELIESRLQTIFAEHPHYLLIGAFLGEKLVGLTGAWVATKVWCGLYLEIDNLVVDPAQRSLGIGTLLIERLEEIGRERDCKVLVIDSYAANRASHRLYHRLGFEIWSFHFIKEIGDWRAS